MFFPFRPQRLSKTTRQTNLHPLPDPRTRKGVPLQPLPDPAATDRNSPCPLPHRATDKNMVPKQTHETQKGTQGRERDKRTGQAGTGGAGETQTAAAGETTGETGAANAFLTAPTPPRSHEDEPR